MFEVVTDKEETIFLLSFVFYSRKYDVDSKRTFSSGAFLTQRNLSHTDIEILKTI